MDYDDAIGRLISWANGAEAVRALILTGSAAAGQTHPLSDRDIEIYATDVEAILADESWWSELGDVLVVERLNDPGWFPSRLVYYAGGKLDLTVFDVAEIASIRRERPFVTLVDKEGVTERLRRSASEASHPSPELFHERVDWAYAAAIMSAKAIVRGEPWVSKGRDGDLKRSLLLMIEWDHRTRYGLDYDVRFLGSRMRDWMDRDVQEELEKCWGRFDADDSAAALRATVALFARLAARTAFTLEFAPFDHGRLHHEVEAILAFR